MIYTKNQNHNKKKGFSLIEILVALSIFALVTTATTTALLAVIEANAKTRTLRSAIDNMTVTVESMSRVLKLGQNYLVSDGGTRINFFDQNMDEITFSLNAGSIIKTKNGSDIPMTAPEITVENLTFSANGLDKNDGQPRVLIFVKGSATGVNSSATTDFSIQTTVTQRKFQCDSTEPNICPE